MPHRILTAFVISAFLVFPVFADTDYPNALPDLRVSKGNKNIQEAWFSDPTRQYTHFVLGSEYEAETLNVKLQDGRRISFNLDKQSVFEDRIPRLFDLDGDGLDEIIVVRAYLRKGAALSVFGVMDNKLKLIAETPDMGHPFGWLNPAGIADFDGDGRIEIAFVRKPHVLGRLELWEYHKGKLTLDHSADGFSNHGIGSKNMQLSLVADFNNDGAPDLALPDKSRTSVRYISFVNGPKEIARKKLPAPVASDFHFKANGQQTSIEIKLHNGAHLILE